VSAKTRLLCIVSLLFLLLTAGVPVAGKNDRDPKKPAPSPSSPPQSQRPGNDASDEDTSEGGTSSDGSSTSGNGSDGDGSAGEGTTSGTASTSAAQVAPAAEVCNPLPFGGLFELEGDATEDAACAGEDWQSVVSADGTTFVADKIGKEGDNTYFFQGGSKDIHDLDSWKNRINDEAPDKDDITNAFARPAIVDGELLVFFGADRFAQNGDAQMGFWFFQDQVTVGAGTFNGAHREGDVLVLVDFTNGGVVRTVKAYRWVDGGGDVSENLDLVASGVDCRVADGGALICGAVNSEDTAAFWAYTPKAGTSGTFPSGSLFEAGINISAVSPGTECLSSYLVETRTSQSVDARLKDFALGQLEVCPTIGGVKFEDLDGDGDRDSGEPTLAGWEIHLFGETSQGDAVHLHTSADSEGAYGFALSPGTYTVCEAPQEGWIQSFPREGPDCSGHDGAGGVGWALQLGIGEDLSGIDFGNFRNATVSGVKFRDSDDDSTRDAGEVGLEGWQIHLFGATGAGGAVHLHTTTAVDGSFSFTVPPGVYTLCESILEGWEQSLPADGVDCSLHGGSDGVPAAGGIGHALTLTSGGTVTSDFGNNFSAVLGERFRSIEGAAQVPGQLPVTGVQPLPLMFLGAVFLLVGAMALHLQRGRGAASGLARSR